jgi:hypothetical protein
MSRFKPPENNSTMDLPLLPPASQAPAMAPQQPPVVSPAQVTDPLTTPAGLAGHAAGSTDAAETANSKAIDELRKRIDNLSTRVDSLGERMLSIEQKKSVPTEPAPIVPAAVVQAAAPAVPS